MDKITEAERALRREMSALRVRLEEAEATLAAIRNDQVDAVVVCTANGDQVFSFRSPEHPYRLFVEKVREGTVTIAPNGDILYANASFAGLVRAPLESLIGQPFVGFLHQDGVTGFHALLNGASTRSGEFQLQCRDGSIVPVYISASTFCVEDASGICLVITDITEQKRNLEMAERLRLSERLASIGTLATGIAHEINNPLNAILLTAQFALREHNPDPEMTDMLRGIIRETHRCARIVKNVLQFARHEKTDQWRADLNATVTRGAELARTYVEDCEISLRFELDPNLPEIDLNTTEIEQVLINLIRNACDAAGPRVTITLRTETADGHVRLLISDDGPGIPADVLSRIFDPFFSTRRERGGTGLGLSIVHGIISKHRGTILARSELGCGTTFCIRLPIPVDDETAVDANDCSPAENRLASA